MVARDRGKAKGLTLCRGMKEFEGMMKIFYILIVVVLAVLYKFVIQNSQTYIPIESEFCNMQ